MSRKRTNRNRNSSNSNKSKPPKSQRDRSPVPQTSASDTSSEKPGNSKRSTVMKLDSRKFSKAAYSAISQMVTGEGEPEYLQPNYRKKASGLIQGLPAYISTWGLHRLSGDAKKFLAGSAEDTKYKGKVYQKFLKSLKAFSGNDFDVENPGSLIHLPLREYTGLNRLAIELAKEWSFWAPSILGEADSQ